ncbi:outer membrane protein assembly factor BamE [Parasulfuritortus cantonensis]|uniref:Outer membrane protein assembly factor BamE n=2 Tax=Parasulfuritortus cantonensis TaxID=2528202 RepID=A0A4R1BDJ8_9PROT|nr:outer membrane protein assembly factor BamE [Parasulfuritortus cantonensis]
MRKLVLVFLVALPLVGCSSWRERVGNFNPIESLTPYHLEIPQGNVVTQEQVSALKPGMSTAQVRFLLGTPLIVDPFHSNRWDYAYSLKKGGDILEQRHITVLFESDRLVRIEGDVVAAPAKPAEAAQPAEPAPAAEAAEAAKP